MNKNTRQALLEFIEAIEILAQAVSSISGTEATSTVWNQAQKLRTALQNDETII